MNDFIDYLRYDYGLERPVAVLFISLAIIVASL